MQSFHSKITEILVVAFANATLQSTISRVISEFFTPMGEFWARFFGAFVYIAGIGFMLAIFMFLFTKYLSIYHGTIIDNLDETCVLPPLRAFALIFPFVACVLEYGLISDQETDSTYQIIR